MRQADLQRARAADVRRSSSRMQQEEASLESARYDLSKVRIESPIDGIVTRRNIEEGETVVIGTMNNAGTVLLTIADMSVIEAEVEVDETDIPIVQIGQTAKITIDAMPGQDVHRQGHRDRQQPDPDDRRRRPATRRPTSRWSSRSTSEIPEVRPGFTCTAEITTATRAERRAVPIQAIDGPRDGRDDKGDDRARAATDGKRAAGDRGRRARRPRSSSRARRARSSRACSSCGTARPMFTPDQDRHRRRQVLRGPDGLKEGDARHHRAVRLGARAGRRRRR